MVTQPSRLVWLSEAATLPNPITRSVTQTRIHYACSLPRRQQRRTKSRGTTEHCAM